MFVKIADRTRGMNDQYRCQELWEYFEQISVCTQKRPLNPVTALGVAHELSTHSPPS